MDINIDNISKENKKELKIQEEFGKKIVEYCSQFKGDKYTIAMKSIEFGYQLAQEELETESIQEEKTSWSREEVIAYGKLTFEVGRNFQLTGENNLPEVEQNL